MIPNINILSEQIVENTYPDRTYKIDGEHSRIKGYVDGLESVRQAVQLILNTERYEHPIYSWDYGIELLDLYGKPTSYVMSELPRRIEEALLTDNRIVSVSDFEFEKNGSKISVTFNVTSVYGTLEDSVTVGEPSYASDATEATLNTVGILNFNVPAFVDENGVLLLNELPYVDDNGVLIF